MKKNLLLLGIFLFMFHQWGISDHAIEDASSQEVKSDFHFTENKGQLDQKVQFHTKLHIGDIYFEKTAFTFDLYSAEDLDKAHEFRHSGRDRKRGTEAPIILRKGVYQMQFIGANANPHLFPEEQKEGLKNYFIGKDQSKWASSVKSYTCLNYRNLYDKIDAKIHTKNNHLKYDFIVKPGGDPAKIKINYKGVESLQVKEGALEIWLSGILVKELKPIAYQNINGRKTAIPCEFVVQGTAVSFRLPHGYDTFKELVIDPTWVFATLTGSTADNWGFTATYDIGGNFYGGGIADGSGYPTTTGAYNVNFGGEWDAVITKFNPLGTGLVYSTYLGGDEADQPHSLVTDVAGNLVVLGVTSSDNFPTTTGAYNENFNLGDFLLEDGIYYNNGTDIFVAKLDANGATLLGSTYIGGSANDGFSLNPNLKFNYADHARGEVVLDANNTIYITSSTRSTNFPAPVGSHQQSLGGNYDGIVSSFSADLTTLNWSTYLGGNQGDAGYSIRISEANNLVAVCGGTNSNNIGATSGALNETKSGGVDGYVATFNKSTGTLNALTYLGTSAYDQAYILEIDSDNDIYVTGQTKGAYPVVGTGVYNNPNSTQFVHKMDNALTTTAFSTVFGSGSSTVNLSITAFLVDKCENIYVAGWGGLVNNEGTTNGMPLTGNAIQLTTDGSDFYFIVLDRDAQNLLYGTYFGSNGAGEHVDGGTSRFDKQGTIYQGVCAGCGGLGFPTSTGAYSSTNGSSNCNYGGIKISLDFQGVIANADNPGDITLCSSPYIVNLSAGLDPPPNAFWDFGDGGTSTDINPSHTYADTGTYQIMYVAIDSSSCNIADTAYFAITLIAAEQFSAEINIPPFDPCDDTVFVDLEFTGTGADSLVWDMGDNNIIYDDTAFTYFYTDTGTYIITMTAYDTVCNNVGSVSDTVVFIADSTSADADVPDNVFMCDPPFEVDFSTTSSPPPPYVIWDFGDGIGTSTLPDVTYTYADTGTYEVTYIAIDSSKCDIDDTAYFTVQFEVAEEFNATFDIPVLPPCRTTDSLWVQLDFTGSGADSIIWDMGDDSIYYNDTIVNHVYTQPGYYLISMTAYDLKCNNNGTIYQSVEISKRGQDFFLPNAFTPNGDGNNDSLFVRGPGISEINLSIYNRWGELVFETKNKSEGWDGSFNEKEADPGVFVYYLFVRYCDGEELFKKGNVTLIK
ncbi:MAG TPA: PKD domain-containing protein [Flavobacteriales bacterium]|nr:PKD domain-containing protein [Flavobacteriales bacterium]